MTFKKVETNLPTPKYAPDKLAAATADMKKMRAATSTPDPDAPVADQPQPAAKAKPVAKAAKPTSAAKPSGVHGHAKAKGATNRFDHYSEGRK